MNGSVQQNGLFIVYQPRKAVNCSQRILTLCRVSLIGTQTKASVGVRRQHLASVLLRRRLSTQRPTSYAMRSNTATVSPITEATHSLLRFIHSSLTSRFSSSLSAPAGAASAAEPENCRCVWRRLANSSALTGQRKQGI